MSNTLFIGKVYQRFDELSSTNDYALETIAKSRPPEGTVLRADRQSAGRGQFGSNWESASGQNLTLSIILYPAWLPLERQFALSQAMALAVSDCVRSWLPEAGVRVKWPNDVYIDRRKTAGILIQNTLAGAVISASVIGIGLNVNQTVFSSDAPNPVSLALYAGRPFDTDAVAETLFACVERRYLQLKNSPPDTLQAAYESELYLRGEKARFETPEDGQFSGVIEGVTTAGHLRVATEAGVRTFELKGVRILGK